MSRQCLAVEAEAAHFMVPFARPFPFRIEFLVLNDISLCAVR
jgi:hypothetical protein